MKKKEYGIPSFKNAEAKKTTNSELDKITSYNYKSKFTAANEKIYEKLVNSSSKLENDVEELEVLKHERKKSEENHMELNLSDIYILSLICFCMELGYSLEIVFITPHFMILDLPPFIDTVIWLFPPILIAMIYPCLQILVEKSFLSIFQKKFTLFFIMLCSLFGLFLLSNGENLALKFSSFRNYSQINYYSVLFAIMGFLFVDIANEMINYIVGWYIVHVIPPLREQAENYICYAGSFGKICGYLISSLLAFNIYIDKIKRSKNFMTFAFSAGLVIHIVCFGLFLFFFSAKQTDSTRGFSFSAYLKELKNISFNSFLPGITLLKKTPNKIKLILLMHFFASCNILMVSVYASSWVGVSILKIDPENMIFSKRRKIFDVGISWGAVALLFSALAGFLTEILIPKLMNYFSSKWIFIVTQSISSVTLLILYNTDAFYSVFLILPLCGISFGTFNTIPEIMTEEIEEKINQSNNYKGIYKQMLKITLFFAEIAMFFGIPCFFLLIPDVNEILVSLIIAAISGLLSVSACYFY